MQHLPHFKGIKLNNLSEKGQLYYPQLQREIEAQNDLPERIYPLTGKRIEGMDTK